MLYQREAKVSVEEVCKRLEEAAKASKFGVIATINLKEKMRAKGVEFGPECRILEICNPNQARTVLEADMTVSAALPCRISVYEQDRRVFVCTIRPTAILGLFKKAGLLPVAQAVEQAVISIIDTA